jgi:UDP-N-acetylmuramoylalanine--D-glutamate ligase
MIAARTFAKCDVGVFGLGSNGIASVRALRAGGAQVFAWDDNAEARREGTRAGAAVIPFADWSWTRLAALVLTAWAPQAFLERAKSAGIEIVADVELFAREIGADPAVPGRAPVVAVTGAAEIAALIAQILTACGFDVQAGAALALEPPAAKTIYVLDLSPDQVELSPSLVPDVTVLAEPAMAKLLGRTSRSGHLVIAIDSPQGAALYTKHAAASGGPAAIPVSLGKVLGRGVFVVDGALYDAQAQRATKMMDTAGLRDPRAAALAYAAAKPFAKDGRAVVRALSDAAARRQPVREAS